METSFESIYCSPARKTNIDSCKIAWLMNYKIGETLNKQNIIALFVQRNIEKFSIHKNRQN